jgi:hypothetical protein
MAINKGKKEGGGGGEQIAIIEIRKSVINKTADDESSHKHISCLQKNN